MLSPLEILLSFVLRGVKTIQHVGQNKKQSNDKLTVIDNRTSKSYEIPIINNAVRASDFRYISTLGLTASPLERYTAGIRIMDPGFQNTAVTESEITYM